MAKIKHCIYCGSTVRNQSSMCSTCAKKLKVLRKLRAIVFSIKRDAERSGQNGKTGNNQDFEAIQKNAC